MIRAACWSVLLGASLAASCIRPPMPRAPEAPGGDVVIRRDRFGVPHIRARTEEAAAFAFGYAQAEDHGPVIVRRLIAARGEEAKYFGESGIENDFAMARLDNLAESRRGLERVSPGFRRVLGGYAAGLNAYLRQRRPPSPWTIPEFDAADVMANLRAPAAAFAGGEAMVRGLRAKYEGRPPGAPPAIEEPGSNALALSGSRTVSGRPLLLGNPHLDWSSLYWEAHVTVPGRMNFYGSTLVGLPVLRAGFNDSLAFVQTNNAPDLDDIYRLPLDPAEPDQYWFENRRYPLTAREVSIDVRSPAGALERRTRTYWHSHLGPILYRDAAAVFALQSMRLDAWQYFDGFRLATQTRNLDEFLGVMRRRYVPTSNFIYADADGNILYLWNARLPRRLDDGSSYELDVPGLQKYLWRGVHDFDDLPRVLNPPGGYLQNTNSPPRFASLHDQIDMARYPSYVERGTLGLRSQLALRMVQEQKVFAADDLVRLKFETRVLLAERVKPPLIAALREASRPTPEAHAGLEALAAWDDRAAADSRGAALFFRFWDTYSRAMGQPFATPWDANRPIETPAGLADSAVAVRHLEDAVRWMRETHGTERAAWGEVNRYRFGDVDLPGEGCSGPYGCFRVQRFVPAALPGPGVAGHLGDNGPVGFGDAWVLIVDFSTRVPTAWSVLAYGQTSDLSSPHSRDQIELLATRRLRPVYFTETDIGANLVREYRPAGVGIATPSSVSRRDE